MNKKFGIFVLVLFFVLVIIPVGAINSSSNDVDKIGYVSASYTAEKEVSPDTVEVSIAVKTEDVKSMSVAINKNKEISDKVYLYLKGVIDTSKGDFLRTSNFSAYPSYQYVNGKNIFDKYTVSNNIIVHTKNIDKIATIIDKAMALGATDVDSLTFSLANKESYCSELLSKAAINSKSRIETVVKATNSSISGIKSIDTSCTVNSQYSGYSRRNKMLMASAMVADGATNESAPNIEAGVIKIFATVNSSYYIK